MGVKSHFSKDAGYGIFDWQSLRVHHPFKVVLVGRRLFDVGPIFEMGIHFLIRKSPIHEQSIFPSLMDNIRPISAFRVSG